MRKRRRGLALAAWLMLIAATVGPPGAQALRLPQYTDGNVANASWLQAEGRLLVTQFLSMTEAAGKSGGVGTFLKPLMSPAYQVLRADGVRETPSTYTTPSVDSFEISNVAASAPSRDVLVVRYVAVVNESIDGRALNSSVRPRLTVFSRGDDGGTPGSRSWQLVSQASFNEPTVPECDKPSSGPPPPPAGDAADLGARVLRDWMKVVAEGKPIPACNPQIQVQFANGSGYTTTKELEDIAAMPIDSLTHLVATRAGNLLVTSYNASTKAANRARPHLTVFLQDGGPLAGNWSMIAQANFYHPKLPMSDPRCSGAWRSSKGGGGTARRRQGAGGRDAALLAAIAAAWLGAALPGALL